MKKTLKGYIAGLLTAALLVGGVSYASGVVRIVIDNQEIIPTDANGNRVVPIIIDGTTYLPLRAVANAFGKAVYWDGPSYTVYLGSMDGTPEYPTKELSINDNIGSEHWYESSNLKDNYGNLYSRAIRPTLDNKTYEILCNMQYSRFKGTIYIADGYSGDYTTQIIIKADGKTIYTSPEISKVSSPVHFDIDITGCNDLQITATDSMRGYLNIGNSGFYQ